jgi:hypothetical protein
VPYVRNNKDSAITIGRRCTDRKNNMNYRNEADSISVIRSIGECRMVHITLGVIVFTSTDMHEQVQALIHIDLYFSKFSIEMLQGL